MNEDPITLRTAIILVCLAPVFAIFALSVGWYGHAVATTLFQRWRASIKRDAAALTLTPPDRRGKRMPNDRDTVGLIWICPQCGFAGESTEASNADGRHCHYCRFFAPYPHTFYSPGRTAPWIPAIVTPDRLYRLDTKIVSKEPRPPK